MNQIVLTKSKIKLALTLILPIIIYFTSPFALNQNQSLIFACLILAITWWSTGFVNKEFTALLLLGSFILFSSTDLKLIFTLPLSKIFVLIVSSFLLSQGMMNSNIAKRVSNHILIRYCKSSVDLVKMSFVLGVVLMFFIPQPFPRVIILSSIYFDFLNKQEVGNKEKSIILFSIFVASTSTSMILLNGDVVLNYASIQLAGLTPTQGEWIKMMTLPSIIVVILSLVNFLAIYKKELVTQFKKIEVEEEPTTRKEKITVVIMLLTVSFWMLESFHGIQASTVALGGVVAMTLFGIISFKDFIGLNYKLLFFMTTIFSIGKVLVDTGIAQKLSQEMIQYLPGDFSLAYILAIIALVMLTHMVIGSSMTTMAVVLVPLVVVTQGLINPIIVALIVYILVNIHYIIPIHHMSIMIGYANGYYDTKLIYGYGLNLTLMVVLYIVLIYIPWWKFVGVL